MIERVSKSVSDLKMNADVTIKRSDGGIQMLLMKKSHVNQLFYTAKNRKQNSTPDCDINGAGGPCMGDHF